MKNKIRRGSVMRQFLNPVLMLLLCSTLTFGQSERKRVALMDFEFGAVQKWWEGNWDIGVGIADLIVNELVNDGTYSVIERKQLDTILAEQNFSNSDRANASTAAQIGKVLGLNAILVGTITQFGTEAKKSRFGGLIGGFGGLGGATVGKSEGKAKVVITARIVDVNTAEILASHQGEGESKRSGMLLGGVGAGSGGFGAGGIEMGSSDFRESILGEAVQAAVEELSQKLIGSEDKVTFVKLEVRGLVADVDGTSVILNVGSSHGVKAGDVLNALRITRTVKDPATGEVLREVTEPVGQVRIDEVDERSSVGTVVSGAGIEVGDMIKN